MAGKTEVTLRKEEVPKKEAPETAPDSPLLDLSDAAVKKLIRTAKKRGYVTHEQINSLSNEYTRGGQLKKRHWYHDTARVGQVQKENWHIVISA